MFDSEKKWGLPGGLPTKKQSCFQVTLTVHEPVTATFALRYLVNFSKAEKLCGSVELGLGPDAPLLVKYDLESGENGHMKFYLAPKIDE